MGKPAAQAIGIMIAKSLSDALLEQTTQLISLYFYPFHLHTKVLDPVLKCMLIRYEREGAEAKLAQYSLHHRYFNAASPVRRWRSFAKSAVFAGNGDKQPDYEIDHNITSCFALFNFFITFNSCLKVL